MSLLRMLLDQCIRDPERLSEQLQLSEEERVHLAGIAERYPICIPPYYLDLIGEQREEDPVWKLCLPARQEFDPKGKADTSGESENTVVPGMQHKYSTTALILTTDQCAMYCRHCFRKRMVGTGREETAQRIEPMVSYVRRHPEINTVILSGGDALVNENEVLRQFLDAFSTIHSVQTIRIATRIPVVMPSRINEDKELLEILKEYGSRKQLTVVTHFNHPKEVTGEAVKAIQELHRSGCPVRNQTVLLKGVNDDSRILAELMNGLIEAGVMPYYIFQCRPAMGVLNQFQVPLLRGSQIVEEAKAGMNGLAKAFRYVMSHVTGKIEILGKASGSEEKLLFKYHQAKDFSDNSRIFTGCMRPEQCWLPDEI